MFTHCSNHECATVFRVTADNLRTAMGMVRCVKCGTVFNALANIVEQRPEGAVIPLGSQLLFQSFGDRVVMDAQTARSLGQGQPVSAEHVPERAGAAAIDGIQSEAEAALAGDDDYLSERERRMRELEAGLAPNPGEFVASSEAATSVARGGGILEWLPRPNEIRHVLRNLLRHRRRTGMGLLAISFGVMAMLLAGGFIEWSNWFLRETTIEAHLGHIQVVKEGYFEAGEADPFAYLIPSSAPMATEIATTEHVVTVTPRLSLSGLISFDDVSISFLGEGVDPTREAQVSKRLTIVEGGNLDSARPDGIIVGKGLAKNLKVEPGATVVLMASPEGGGLGAVEAQVVGIFQTSNKASDDASLRMPIAMAQRLIRVDGAHRWIVLLDDTGATQDTLAALRARFAGTAGFEFVPWSDLADFYNKTAKLFAAQVNVVWVVIALIIVVSISNTLIMNVMERTGEIGTLMALGLRRRKILMLFLSEGVALGALGGVVGAAVGWLLAKGISAIGIPMPPAPGMDFPVDGLIMVTAPLVIGGVILGLGATIAASIYPARKAARLEIVDALRHAR